MSVLSEIQGWYLAHCDGVWEHRFGIKIDTIDNPGWSVVIDLPRPVQERSVTVERSDGDWYVCKIIDTRFEAFCGANNLEEVLNLFLSWVS